MIYKNFHKQSQYTTLCTRQSRHTVEVKLPLDFRMRFDVNLKIMISMGNHNVCTELDNKIYRDVLFEFHLKFWNTTSIGIPVRSLL